MPDRRITVPAFTRDGRQLPAGEAAYFKRAVVESNVGLNSYGAALDKPQALQADGDAVDAVRRLLQERIRMGGVAT